MAPRVRSEVVKNGRTYRAGDAARRAAEEGEPLTTGVRELRALRGRGARPVQEIRAR